LASERVAKGEAAVDGGYFEAVLLEVVFAMSDKI